MKKTKKSFGEIWAELSDEQKEYLKEYINTQRQEAIDGFKKNCQPNEIDVTRCPNCKSTDHKIDKPYKCYDCGTVW